MTETHLYDDIIDLPHHVSEKHPPMAMRDRAAQFSPFAALTGYGAAVDETARITDSRIELSDDAIAGINDVLSKLGQGDTVRLEYFVPDHRKAGGTYMISEGRIRSLRTQERVLVLTDGNTIPFEDIIAIEKAAEEAARVEE